jgi:hypothetical protein
MDDFKDFLGNTGMATQDDPAMQIEKPEERQDLRIRVLECGRRLQQFGVKVFGDLFESSEHNVSLTLEW